MLRSARFHLGLFSSFLAVALLVGCGGADTKPAPKPSKPSDSGAKTDGDKKSNGEPAASSGNGAAKAEGWGTLKGRFVFDGEPPENKAVTPTKDVEFCSKHAPTYDTIVVNKENNGVANVFIQLNKKKGSDVPIHESYAETAESKVTLDNKGCRFVPHVAAIRTTQTLLVKNSDDVSHNTKIDTRSNAPQNPNLPAGSDLEMKFTKPERVSPVSCSIHPWMTAWLIVRDDPYFAVSDADGNFEIKNLPAGEWEFYAWHEGTGHVSQVTVGGSSENWTRGKFKKEIKPEDNDMGDIKISAKLFEP